MEILEILEEVRLLLKDKECPPHVSEENMMYGLCSIVRGVALRSIHIGIVAKFAEFYRDENCKDEKEVFYDYGGVETCFTNQFGWRIHEKQPRLDWLDEKILMLKRKDRDGDIN